MDRVPGKLPNTCSRLIAMAASLLGEPEQVMREMGCSEEDFRQYCEGQREPSWPQLDKLVTLIVREQGKIIAANRALLAKIHEDRPH